MPRGRKMQYRAMPFLFPRMEPGEVATIERTDARTLRPRRVVINPSSYGAGLEYDDFAIDGKSYEARPAVPSNPTLLRGYDIPAGSKICLSLRNVGERAAHAPSAVVVFEIVG